MAKPCKPRPGLGTGLLKGTPSPQGLAEAFCSSVRLTPRPWEPAAGFHQGSDMGDVLRGSGPLWGEVTEGAGGCTSLGGPCNVFLGNLVRWVLPGARMLSLAWARVLPHACSCVPFEGCPGARSTFIALVLASAQVQVLWTAGGGFHTPRGVSLSRQLV